MSNKRQSFTLFGTLFCTFCHFFMPPRVEVFKSREIVSAQSALCEQVLEVKWQMRKPVGMRFFNLCWRAREAHESDSRRKSRVEETVGHQQAYVRAYFTLRCQPPTPIHWRNLIVIFCVTDYVTERLIDYVTDNITYYVTDCVTDCVTDFETDGITDFLEGWVFFFYGVGCSF